jgi:hypothetical protein
MAGTNNPDPLSFPASESGTVVTFSGPGTYTILEGLPPSFLPTSGGSTTFSGACTKTTFNTATGIISAGEHQICITTNTQGEQRHRRHPRDKCKETPDIYYYY